MSESIDVEVSEEWTVQVLGANESHDADSYTDAVGLANAINTSLGRACALSPKAPRVWAVPVRVPTGLSRRASDDAGFDDVLEWADYVAGLIKGACQDCGQRCGWHLTEISESLVLLVPELVSEIRRLRGGSES
ncbi:Uncharacterised protein [Mycobacteroides abscessus]|nr:Uncharacterised protein [Mycobacteroides abscessus]